MRETPTRIKEIESYMAKGGYALESANGDISFLLRALADAERRLAERAVPCAWKEDSEGKWETACGQLFYFNEGGVEENNFHFCHGCGHQINATKYVDPPIDDDEPLPAAPEAGKVVVAREQLLDIANKIKRCDYTTARSDLLVLAASEER